MPVQYSSAVHLLNPALTRRPRWRGDRTIDTCAGRVSASRYAWIITCIHVTILIGEKFFLSRYLTLLSSGIINSGVKSDARRVARPARPDASVYSHVRRAPSFSLLVLWAVLLCGVLLFSSLLPREKSRGGIGKRSAARLDHTTAPPTLPCSAFWHEGRQRWSAAAARLGFALAVAAASVARSAEAITRRDFPEGFVFGAGTSAYQVRAAFALIMASSWATPHSVTFLEPSNVAPVL
jgi:hypothetical protein